MPERFVEHARVYLKALYKYHLPFLPFLPVTKPSVSKALKESQITNSNQSKSPHGITAG